jgi:hypothetical protein
MPVDVWSDSRGCARRLRIDNTVGWLDARTL